MKKNKIGDANNSPILILLFAVIFVAGGVAAIVLGGAENWIIVVGIILAVCGAFLVFYGVYRAVIISKVKALDKNPEAYITDAQFVKSVFSGYTSRSTEVGVGGVDIPTSFKLTVFKKIIYTYKDMQGIEHKAKSVFSFTPNQAKYLEEKKTFKIKCDGDVSLIIEDVPKGESTVDL